MEPRPRSDSSSAVLAAALAAGALIAQQVAGKATRDALFLSTFAVSSLPPMMIGAALVSAVAVLGLSTALSRWPPARLVPAVVATGTMLLLAEWGLSLVEPRLAAVAVYLYVAAFGATVVSAFWSLVNERFDPHAARAAMGRIGLGASVGGVSGGLLAWGVSGLLPVPAMLAVMAAFNVGCLVALRRLGDPPGAVPGVRSPDTSAVGALSGLRLVRDAPYLRDLGAIVALGAAAEALLDYVLNLRAVEAFPGGPALMSFFALFHTAVALAALAVQAVVARHSLERLGLAGTVALRPAAVAAAALTGAWEPRLATALLARATHGVLHNSLFRSGYELLFTPLPERRKRPAKAIVDVGFDKLGTAAGGALVLAVLGLPGADAPRVLFFAAFAAGLLALALSRRLHQGYVAALEESLRSGVVRIDAGEVIDGTTLLTLVRGGFTTTGPALHRGAPVETRALETIADPVLAAAADLRSGDPERMRAALKRPASADPALVGHLVPLLARNDVFLDVVRALRRALPRATGQLVDALLDPATEARVRRRIPRVLRGHGTARAVSGLLQAIDLDSVFDVRRQCALALARVIEKDAALAPPPGPLFAAALRELRGGPMAWTEEIDPEAADDGSPDARPRTPAERGLAHVFTLLSLAVDREPMQIAYWALQSGDERLRGTALEYLENVLPEDVRDALWTHLGFRPLAAAARPRDKVVDELMHSGATMGLSRDVMRRMLLGR